MDDEKLLMIATVFPSLSALDVARRLLSYLPQNNAEGADYGVEGRVTMADASNNQQRVEVLWIVTRRDGQEIGQVLQMNEVPKGSLNRFWADVAYVVADEASAGIRDVLRNAGSPPGP